ncbi:MAG: deoxyhypusine synthase [Candidatus Aenigmatarchaeota archaeon]
MKKPIKHIKIVKNQTVDNLVKQMTHTAFNARRLGHGADLLETMIKEKDCKVFMTLAGAMTPAGMKDIIHNMLEKKWIDVMITTGANLTHDLVESLDHHHYQLDNYDDKELAEESIYRIYDCFMPGDVYIKLEKFIQSVIDKMVDNMTKSSTKDLAIDKITDLSNKSTIDKNIKTMTIQEFLHEFGKHCPENSILNICSKNNIPLFCPALADSGLGIQIWFYIQDIPLKISALDDLKEIFNIAWSAEHLGVFIIGGGVPKNYAMQAFQFSKSAKYFVQITSDREEYGGLSGATPQEAISWGKLSCDANYADIRCDATIALPLIYSCLINRLL